MRCVANCEMRGIGEAKALFSVALKRAFCSAGATDPLPTVDGMFVEGGMAVASHRLHGGPREVALGARTGANDPVVTKRLVPQCGQACHSMPATRCMNAATDSTTAGSGMGAPIAARAALPAGIAPDAGSAWSSRCGRAPAIAGG